MLASGSTVGSLPSARFTLRAEKTRSKGRTARSSGKPAEQNVRQKWLDVVVSVGAH